MSFDELADGLHDLDPADFVAARDAAVKEARSAGDRALAAQLAALRRPTVAAWTVNLLARADPDLLTELLDLGEALRAAHATLSITELRPLSAQRNQLVAAVTRRAGQLAADHGRASTDAVLAEVSATLQAALADPAIGEQVRAGRLSQAQSWSGFGPAAGTATSSSTTSTTSSSRPDTARSRAEQSQRALLALREARDRLRTVTTAIERHRVVLEEATEQAEARERELADADAEIAALTAELEQARAVRAQIAPHAEQARQDLAEARTEADRLAAAESEATAALDELTDSDD